ncbi:hypothetical protein PybrP1_012837 [[Pythium] brassicae (nom. inval.)]|nr:hypothetical protein PybrP1_012837 [[Pythium] brassicae (nom. inval.)]
METLRAASPTYSLADRRKELVGRVASAGPLALSDLCVAAANDDSDDGDDNTVAIAKRENLRVDFVRERDEQQPPTPDDDRPARLDSDCVGETDDNDEEDEEDEDALRAQFFRQQQRDAALSDDVDAFLVRGLQLQLPTADTDEAPLAAATHNNKPTMTTTTTTTKTHEPKALTASMHALTTRATPPRRRRQSSALLPDGVLHLWVYRACRLAFRQHFESMYERHGLHLRCYLSWRKQCLSRPVESRRNVGGNMTNPVWRSERDHAPALSRGHFAVPLGDRASPESLPANTELVIEVVCGILVVSAARVSLLEFFQDRASRSSDDDSNADSSDDTHDSLGAVRSETGIVRVGQQWHPLVGQDTGQLEMSLEFVPASAGNNDDDGIAWLESAEPEVQDPTAQLLSSDADELHCELEHRTLTRKTRFECTGELQLTTRESGHVLVSNNGKTTMYIPPQCRHPLASPPTPPLSGPTTNSVVSYTAPPPSLTSTSPSNAGGGDRQMDEQLLDLYLHGISSDGFEPSSYNLRRTSSAASQFSLEFSERSEASVFSRKASTCATDVWAYNELIKDMESSLEAEQRDAGAVRKADAMLRRAAPTLDPHPTTAAMGVIPTKSALKKKQTKPATRQPSNNDALNDDDDDDDDDGDDDDEELFPASSVRETTPKGVVLFDLASIPERLRSDFERSVSDDNMKHRKKDAAKGRRRSLPVNSLSLGLARPGAGFRPQHVTIDEHERDKAESRADRAASRRRRSSLHSLADLHAKALEDAARRRQRQQQQQLVAARGGDRASTVGVKPQRRNSNSNSVVHVGGAVLGVGKFINIGNVPGVVRYVGPTEFASGTWIGVELCEKKGKNDGAVRGVKYFSCAPDYGIFVRADRLDIGA